MALLIPITLLFTCIGTAGKLRQSGIAAAWRSAVLFTLLSGFILVALSTELLSVIHALNTTGVTITWVIACVFSVIWMVRHRRNAVFTAFTIFQYPAFYWIAFVLITTAVTGLLAFPNNWDSMTYHLARVMQWLHRDSVAHYSTQIVRQLSLAPLSEYAMAHLFALQSWPSLGILVQWSCFGGSLIAVTLITRTLGGDHRAQWLSAVIGACIPMAILQASSTQNDLVESFFVLCAMWFLLEMRKPEGEKYNWFFFFAAAACAALTKGTALFFLAPATAVALAVAVQHRLRIPFRQIMAGSALAILILLPHHLRNMHTFGSPGGVDYDLQNERFGVAPVLSGIAKNTAIHLRTPIGKCNAFTTEAVEKWHQWIGIDVQDTALNWAYSPPYTAVGFSTHEDLAGNTVHIILCIVIIPFILLSKKWRVQKNMVLYASLCILMWVFFCALLKWQVWHTRLHTPVFLAAVPLIAMVMCRWHARIRTIVLIILAVYSLPFLFMNQIRPLLWPTSLSRNTSLFSSNSMLDDLTRNNNDICNAYAQLGAIIDEQYIDTLGIISGGDSWEYPLWFLGKQHPSMILNLLPENNSKNIRDPFAGTIPDAIVIMRNMYSDDTLQYQDHLFIRYPFTNGKMRVYLRRKDT